MIEAMRSVMTFDLVLLVSYNFHRQRNTVMDSIFMVAVEHNKLPKDVADALDLTMYYDAKLPEYVNRNLWVIP